MTTTTQGSSLAAMLLGGDRPQPVEIVRPKRSLTESVGLFIGFVISYFFAAWVVMLLTPAVGLPFRPSYWQSLGIYYLARTLLGNGEYLLWSRPRRTR
jgi:hypothetical protein